MSKFTFYFYTVLGHTKGHPTPELVEMMCNILSEFNVPMQVHFIGPEEMKQRFIPDSAFGGEFDALGFAVRIPGTDNSIHSMEEFFQYILHQKLWEKKV